jgi:hypothetical protein
VDLILPALILLSSFVLFAGLIYLGDCIKDLRLAIPTTVVIEKSIKGDEYTVRLKQ